MYVPEVQKMATAGLAFASLRSSTNIFSSQTRHLTDMFLGAAGGIVIKGSVLDYVVEKCIDGDGEVRCSKPFPVKMDSCHRLEWSKDDAISHTTVAI